MIEINRPLIDKERSLLLALATRELADQFNRTHPDADPCTHDQASDVLDRLVREGKLEIAGDAVDACVRANGAVLVEVKRDWLAFHAAHPGENPMKDRRYR